MMLASHIAALLKEFRFNEHNCSWIFEMQYFLNSYGYSENWISDICYYKKMLRNKDDTIYVKVHTETELQVCVAISHHQPVESLCYICAFTLGRYFVIINGSTTNIIFSI